MHNCTECNLDITDAKYLLMKEQIYKSCPGCSKEERKHIFYKCPDEFGQTSKRITKNNPMGLQSHCFKCRANHKGPHDMSINCKQIKEKNGIIISEIRFLPMSKEVFPTYEEAREFLLFDMPARGNTYYYRKSKMECADNSMVLFQYAGCIIGYAIYNRTCVLTTPSIIDGVEYNGYYEFKNGSVRVLNSPITSEMFKTIDSEFKGFNQSHQRKAAGFLPALFTMIEKNNGVIKSEDLEDILPEELDYSVSTNLKEGQKKQIVVNAYERNPKARRRCIEYYKKLNNGRVKCEICGFDFGDFYGEDFKDKIHVHHIKEISTIGEKYVIDAEKDLIPICPNCHLVVHTRKPAMEPGQLRDLIRSNNKINQD